MPRAPQSPRAEDLGHPSEAGRGPSSKDAAKYIWAPKASNPQGHVLLACACTAHTSKSSLLLSSPTTYVDSAQSPLAA